MSSRQSLGRYLCATLLASIALTGCGATQVSPSLPATVTPSAPPATAAPTPTSVPIAVAPVAVVPAVAIDPTIADLTGVKTDPARAHRLPIAVTIDDNRVARPQAGFNGASIVYQAPADGGETRYMMVFQEGDSAAIGPVRSARMYFVLWASEVDAAIGHYGGDLRSRTYLRLWNNTRFTNVDALGSGGKAYHRISSRSAPHNGYTSTAALRAMAARLGGPVSVPPDIGRRLFVAPGPPSSLPASQHLVVPYRTGRIDYRFDRSTDLYRRYVDGAVQIDQADGRAVTTRNVAVLFMSFKTDTKIEPGHSRPVIGNIGSGRAAIFEEGRHIEGTWSKTDDTAPTRLFDAAGHEIPLVTGRTFFQIVPLDTKISF